MIQSQDWNPMPRQIDALERTEFEVLYGGARGGGKTDAGMGFLTYDYLHPLYRALVIRKNALDLTDWLDRAGRFYARVGAEVVGSTVRFRKGGIIRTGHLKDDNAYQKYQGHEYQKMLIEEVTQIPSETNYKKLAASCRSTVPGLIPQIFSTANPDGPGFNWVKKRFRLHGIPKKPIRAVDEITGLPKVFIPARVQDNRYLMENDPGYIAMLNGLPDGLREAWRDGSWDEPIVPGAYYTMALLQATRENRIKLVPHDVTLPVHTVWDLGIGEQLVCGFFQRVTNEIRIIDEWQGEGSDGLPQASVMLQRKAQERGFRYGKHFAPHDGKKTETGTGLTIVQTASKLNLRFDPVPSVSISDGITLALMMLPRLWISEPYTELFLSAIRQYRKTWDEQRLDWKDEPHKDWTNHFADLLRYAALVEDQMTNEEAPAFKDTSAAPVSEYEGGQYEERIPMLDGKPLAMM